MTNLLQSILDQHKDTWFYRQISGYKGKVYFRFSHIEDNELTIIMDRYYPKTKKWETVGCNTVEYMSTMYPEEDEEVLTNLNAKYAVFLLTRKR